MWLAMMVVTTVQNSRQRISMRSKTQFRVGACSCFSPRTGLMLTHLRDGIRRNPSNCYFVTQAKVTNTAKKSTPPAKIHIAASPRIEIPLTN